MIDILIYRIAGTLQKINFKVSGLIIITWPKLHIICTCILFSQLLDFECIDFTMMCFIFIFLCLVLNNHYPNIT